MADIKYLLEIWKERTFGKSSKVEIYIVSNAITFWGIEDKLKIKGQGDILEAGTRMFAQKMIMQHPDTKESNCKMWKSKWLGENRTSRENASFVCLLFMKTIAKSILLELQSSIFQMIKNRLLGNTS
ncbi:MAG: hypothetical protein ACLURP_16490 [Ruminococcus sp.]